MTNPLPPIDLDALRNTLRQVAAAWVLQLKLQVVEARRGEVVMTLPVSAALVHAGGVLCGQALIGVLAAAHATTTYALL